LWHHKAPLLLPTAPQATAQCLLSSCVSLPAPFKWIKDFTASLQILGRFQSCLSIDSNKVPEGLGFLSFSFYSICLSHFKPNTSELLPNAGSQTHRREFEHCCCHLRPLQVAGRITSKVNSIWFPWSQWSFLTCQPHAPWEQRARLFASDLGRQWVWGGTERWMLGHFGLALCPGTYLLIGFQNSNWFSVLKSLPFTLGNEVSKP
jgi:hypothetical protein